MQARERDMSVLESAAGFIRSEARAVDAVADQVDDTFVRAARLLLGCAGRVVTTGAGTSGFVARRAAHLFAVTGTPAFFLHPTEGVHGSLGAVQAGDVLFALSKGGESSEVNALVRSAKARDVSVVAVTSEAESTFGGMADVLLLVSRDDQADPGGVIAMGSTLGYGALLDALAVVVMRTRGYSWERVLDTHPAGAVGLRRELPPPLSPLVIATPEAIATPRALTPSDPKPHHLEQGSNR